MSSDKPHFTIVKNAQKPGSPSFDTFITDGVLLDIAKRITGRKKYTVTFIEDGYNIGRLAILEYQGLTHYISFSIEGQVGGRNYFFQSLTSAIVRYHLDETGYGRKRIYFYFLPLRGNVETEYHKFMYRLMATTGVIFLNPESALTGTITPFSTVDDIMRNRDINRKGNRGNNSTYLTKGATGIPQIYCKTYGANKKEAVLLSMAVSRLAPVIELYEIREQNLVGLPAPDLRVIQRLGKVTVIPTDLTFEKGVFETNNSLRSPKFTYNLLDKLGPKKCALCGCEIPEIIEGAHIWPVTDIKKAPGLSEERQIAHAIDGDNGIWLCSNHHGLFDDDYIRLMPSGRIQNRPHLETEVRNFIDKITLYRTLDPAMMTAQFIRYLNLRNAKLRNQLRIR